MPLFTQRGMRQGISNATARTSIANATDGIAIPNEKHLAQPETALPRTSPMYGGFDAPHRARWLIYGIRFPKNQVSPLEFRHPYLGNRSWAAIYKPLGSPRTPKSAIDKRVTRRSWIIRLQCIMYLPCRDTLNTRPAFKTTHTSTHLCRRRQGHHPAPPFNATPLLTYFSVVIINETGFFHPIIFVKP